MKLLVVGNGWAPEQEGGLNRYVTNLSRTLAERGVPQVVVLVGPVTSRKTEYLRVAGSREQSVVRRLYHLTRAISKELADCDVVVTHFALSAIPLLWLRPKQPLVVHFHGPWAAESRSAGSRAFSVFVKRVIEKALYARACRMIVLSESFAHLLAQSYSIQRDKIGVIPPGALHTANSDRVVVPPTVAPMAKRFLCVRRLVPRMGIDVLLGAWKLAALGDVHRLTIVGDGPQRSHLESLAESLGVASSVEFRGKVSDEELITLYEHSAVSVIPTKELEGFGLIALESLACGTPYIAADVGGLGEFTRQHFPEWVFAPGDANALAIMLRSAAVGTTLPSSAHCLEIALMYSWDNVAHKVCEEYEMAIDRQTLRR